MFRRLGLALKALPEKRRKDLLGLLAEGVAPPGTGPESPVPDAALAIARSMAEGYSDREFLELLASLLSLEEKGKKRLLRVFEIIAAERDVRGSLLPLLRTWKRENLREKRYFAAKTWEAIERLLIDREEKPDVGEDPGKCPGPPPAWNSFPRSPKRRSGGGAWPSWWSFFFRRNGTPNSSISSRRWGRRSRG
jgi:hypothetical protein